MSSRILGLRLRVEGISPTETQKQKNRRSKTLSKGSQAGMQVGHSEKKSPSIRVP